MRYSAALTEMKPALNAILVHVARDAIPRFRSRTRPELAPRGMTVRADSGKLEVTR